MLKAWLHLWLLCLKPSTLVRHSCLALGHGTWCHVGHSWVLHSRACSQGTLWQEVQLGRKCSRTEVEDVEI